MSLTPEQIQELLNSAAGKTALQSAVDEAVKGLKNKNSELLGSVKELKDKIAEIEAAKDDVEAEAAKKTGDVDKIKAQLEAKHKKEIDAMQASIAKLNGQLETNVIGEGLTKALVKVKIAPDHMDAVTALIRSNFKGEVGDNDGTPFAKFNGKAVEEFVSEWAQTDIGKRYVLADNNSGGGANGANGSGKAGNGNGTGKKTMNRADFEALSPADKVVKAREGFTLTDG